MTKSVYPNPFGYNEIEQRACKTFYEQREATRKEPMQEIYQGNGLLAFQDNYEAPTPQLALVDGYKSAEEIKETENDEHISDEENDD